MINLTLREVERRDLDAFFLHQQDNAAMRMAAFTPKDPSDRSAFDAHWTRLLADDEVSVQTIAVGGLVTGHVMSFVRDCDTEVSYWIDRSWWGHGIAQRALATFTTQLRTRPLHARVAKDNTRSLAVLRRCGFAITGEDAGFANGRDHEVEEYLLTLA